MEPFKKNQNNINNDEKLIEKVDQYNINRLLMNIFKKLIIKAESKYSGSNKTDNNFSNNNEISQLIEKVKDNYPLFFFNNQLPNEDFGIFFTNMKDIQKSYLNSKTFNENDGYTLLGYFEEEIRNFFKSHPFEFKNPTEKNKNDTFVIEKKINEITKILKENDELIGDMFSEFKDAQGKDKQKYIDYINQQHSKINNALEDIKSYTFNSLNSEQSFQSFNKFKENLILEQKQKENDIQLTQALLQRYTSQGEEMNQLMNEYKKYCNMIDCLKNKV